MSQPFRRLVTLDEIITAVRAGDLDQDLNRIGEEINQRYKARRREAVGEFNVGDKVTIKDHPQLRRKNQAYWIGQVGTIIQINQQTVNVDMGTAGTLKVPATLLELVPA